MAIKKHSDDPDLIQAANAGIREAFQSLYFKYREWVYSLAYNFCGNEHDAADVLQETFFYLFKKFPGFELTCKMKTFLYPVVKHLALTHKHKSKRNTFLEEEAEEIPAREERDENAERRDLLEMVNRLPEYQREVLMLRFADGLDLSEIAQTLQIPVGTVKSRLHNAIVHLRSHIPKILIVLAVGGSLWEIAGYLVGLIEKFQAVNLWWFYVA